MIKCQLKIFLLLCAVLTPNMARIDHWQTIRKNILIERYDPMQVSLGLLAQLKALDHQRTILLRKLGRSVEIYLPTRSPVVEKKVLREGRLVEISDSKFQQTFIKEYRSIHLIEAVDKIENITNIISSKVLSDIDYDNESYCRVTTTVYDDRGIFRLPAVREENVI